MNRKIKYYVKDLASFILYPRFLQKTKKNYLALCCIVKDENEYLDEWIWYHRKVGVEQFYIFDNNSKVPVTDTLKQLIAEGIVTVDVIDGSGMQMEAYQRCLDKYGKESQWIGFIDTDEFLVPKDTNDLRVFLERYADFGGLGVNWVVFGSAGHLTRPQDRQIRSFLSCASPENERNGHIKSIVQPRFVKRAGGDPHHFVYKKLKYCVNELFDKISGSKVEHSTRYIQLNHYYLRSLDEFKAKMQRGRGDGVGSRVLDDFYRADKECNERVDTHILKHIEYETD